MSKNNKQGFRLTIDTLEDITFTIAEYQNNVDVISLINLIDHYRAYLRNYANEKLEDFTFVKFDAFIVDQELINAVSTYVAKESSEAVSPPKAVTLQTPPRIESGVY